MNSASDTRAKRFRFVRFVLTYLALSLALWHCVIDPKQLFPGPKDAAAPDAPTRCYQECIAKGNNEQTCKNDCFVKNPAESCYYPCIKAGMAPSACKTKCYQTTSSAKCFLLCQQKGYSQTLCDARLQFFKDCLAQNGDEVTCQGKCMPDPTTECYDPCMKKRNDVTHCKQRSTDYLECLQRNKTQCKELCQ